MDQEEPKTFEMTTKEVKLARKLHQYISSGNIIQAKSLIEKLSPAQRHRLTRPNKDHRLHPALLLAIQASSIEMVKFLVNECRANFLEKILVKSWSCLNTIASKRITDKIWMAPLEMCLWGNVLDIAEFLVSVGADMESLAKDVETLFRACRTGSIEPVQILLDHGADVNTSDELGHTCLMAAAAARHVDVCRFLIDNGADIRKIDRGGDTALHKATIWDNLSTVKLFVEAGADALCKNNNELDALHMACRNRAVETVDYLIKTVFTDVNRHIEAFKFLGTCFLFEGNEEEALLFWKRAIELSSQCGIVTTATTFHTPFGVVVEATTVSELDILSRTEDQLYMQCVLFAHEIFGPTHTEFFNAIFEGMDYFVKGKLYERFMHHVIYCFEMIQNSNLDLRRKCSEMKSFHAQIKFATRMFHKTVTEEGLNFDLVYDFTRRVVEEAVKCTHVEETEILTKLIVNGSLLFTYVRCDNRQKMDFHELLQCAIRTSSGRTLLVRTLKRYNFRKDLPHLKAIALLLECGVDINERDEGGNGVLHILMAAYMESRPAVRYVGRVQLLYINKIVKKLARMFVENGVHLDARNHQGLEATSFLKKLGIRVVPPINLMCSAARAIRRFEIPVEGVLPKFLADFVEMH